MKIQLHFGALAEPIGKQLKQQRVTMPKPDLARCQHLADSITMLAVHSFLGERQVERLRHKVMRQITKAASPV